jgi:hypothetical protein
MRDPRRTGPRIAVEAFCTEIADGRERHVLVADLSEVGFRVARPYLGGPTPRVIQLELELPGIDEIIWAKGLVCFDQVRKGLGGLVRMSGVRIAAAAAHDLRLLRDYVIEMWRAGDSGDDLAFLASSSRFSTG